MRVSYCFAMAESWNSEFRVYCSKEVHPEKYQLRLKLWKSIVQSVRIWALSTWDTDIWWIWGLNVFNIPWFSICALRAIFSYLLFLFITSMPAYTCVLLIWYAFIASHRTSSRVSPIPKHYLYNKSGCRLLLAPHKASPFWLQQLLPATTAQTSPPSTFIFIYMCHEPFYPSHSYCYYAV